VKRKKGKNKKRERRENKKKKKRKKTENKKKRKKKMLKGTKLGEWIFLSRLGKKRRRENRHRLTNHFIYQFKSYSLLKFSKSSALDFIL
jgi:hypothetical protein